MKLLILVLTLLQLVVAQEYEEPLAERAEACTINRPESDFVWFKNPFNYNVSLYWYKEEINKCRKRPTNPTLYYGQIPAGGSRRIGTQQGHVFRILDADQKIVGCVAAKLKG